MQTEKTPPRLATCFLRWYCHSELVDEVEGDLHELFQRRVETKGLWRAQLLYWLNVLMFLHPDYIRKRTKPYPPNPTAMFRNYFTITVRQLKKNRAFTLINLSGLALGMAAFILILQYVSFQQSFNRFHTQLPNLYRVLFTKNDESLYLVSPGVATFSQENFAGVANACRIAQGVARGAVTYQNEQTGRYEQSYQEAEPIAYADGSFFRLFSFPVLQGSPDALQAPNTVAISASYAQKYFGNQEPLGKVLTLNNMFGSTPYTVGTVYQDPPPNSNIRYDMLFSLSTLANPANRNGNDWARLDDNLDSQYLYTYLLLKEEADHQALAQGLNAYKQELQPEDEDVIHLQPFRHVHLAQSLDDTYPTTGKLSFIYMLSVIALLILVIAWFNYVNLSTAGALKRSKEVGIRKVVGAQRGQLTRQFLGESFLLNMIALGLALVLVALLQDNFNQLTGQQLSLSALMSQPYWVPGLLLLLLGSVLSGSYTALALSSFRPLLVLKGSLGKIGRGGTLRRVLVVFQFAVSITLIVGTLVLFRQLQFVQNRDLSMDINQLLVIYGPSVGTDDSFVQRTASFENALGQLSYVQEYTGSGSVPGMYYNFSTSGVTKLNPAPNDDKKIYSFLYIDQRYLDTYGIKLLAGQNFTSAMCERPPAEVNQVMVNEEAALSLGFSSASEAVGQTVMYGREREIIGVVKDYNHQSLKEQINPMIFVPRNSTTFFTVRLTTDQIQTKVSELEAQFKQFFPGNPFEFFFADDFYNKQYQAEQQYQRVFTAASCLAIFIACLGLFGIAAFTAQQRVKEISIRKVLGASVSNIVTLLSRDFLVLVLVADIFAWPLAWWASQRWLQDFAYQVEIGWWIFAVASGAALLIAIFTISFQAIRAATANPADSLRD